MLRLDLFYTSTKVLNILKKIFKIFFKKKIITQQHNIIYILCYANCTCWFDPVLETLKEQIVERGMNLSRSQDKPTSRLTIPCSKLSRLQKICVNNNSKLRCRLTYPIYSDREREAHCANYGKAYSFAFIIDQTLLSSMDSDLEAFSHNPTDGSFNALAVQLTFLPII